ncbi:MAG: type II secretion system F family protein [Ruminiclostridium sp.]|nr:type II secretion system F family protein [Ruminiclostridium sp.]
MKSKKQLSNMSISVICSELATIIKAGITITDGMFIICEDETDKLKKRILTEMIENIEKGGTVYSAFESTKVFPSYFLEMISVGEKTGKLDTVLESMAAYYSQLDEISSSVKSAVIYPSVLLITVFAVVILMAVYVLPIFSEVFAQMGLTMSDTASAVITVGRAISNYAVYILAGLALLIIFGVLLYSLVPPVKKFVNTLASHTKIAKSLYCARFASSLSMTLSSGMDIDSAMEMSEKFIENQAIRQRIAKCRQEMEAGIPFSEAIVKTKLFPPLYAKMINIGFSTGTLDKVMKSVAEKTEAKVEAVINTTVSRFEPTMIIIMAVTVGFILLSVMLPLLGIMAVIN